MFDLAKTPTILVSFQIILDLKKLKTILMSMNDVEKLVKT